MLALAAFAALTAPAWAKEPLIYAVNGVAISGYDVVALMTERRATRGSDQHALVWRGATWLFVNDETLETFEMNPTAYAPQYGGYRAEAVSEGRLAPPAPGAFVVVAGKLYMLGSDHDRASWAADAAARIEAADRNWPALVGH
jgi:YHS domain-containing protein